MINYNEIIKNVDIEKVKLLLESLKIDFKEKENYLIMPTICHHLNEEEASYKLYYYKNTKLFYRYTECGSMSIFKFLERYYKSHNIEYDWYEDILKVIEKCSVNKTINSFEFAPIEKRAEKYKRKNKIILPTYPKELIDVFQKFYPPEWLQEGISKSTMDKYNIRYSISQNKIIIPHYNINNELVGIRGRALDEWEIENVGKYLPVKIEDTYYSHPLSLNLYGLNFNKDNIRKNGYCFIYEGEKSVLQADSFQLDNCGIAICGSNLNKYALSILLKECYPKEIIIAFDKEEKEGECKYFNKLYNLCSKYKNLCDFSFIYDKEDLLPSKASPTDKGEVVFEKLLKNRVKVK